MKSKMVRVLPLLLILLSLTTCKGKETGDTKSWVEEQALPGHPRLLLLRGDEQKIKENIETDPTWKKIHEAIIHEGDRILSKPLVEYRLSGKRLLERSRECRKKIFYWAYAYRLTHDKKYLKRAEEELLNVSAFPDWNPSHFLDVAEMTMAVAIGYDWLYDDLSIESRKKISSAIIKMGLEPSLKSGNDWWVTEDGNWNQVCNAGMIFGALAIYDDNKEFAQKIINRSVESVKLAMRVYEPDGAYPEGYSYWAYGTTFNVYLVDALVKAYKTDFGLLESKGFMKTPSYLLHMVGPTTLNFNYSDGEAKSKLNPAMFWFANKLKDPSLLFSESKLLQIKDNLSGRELPAIMIWGAGIKLNMLPTPQQVTWKGQGKNPVALMRTSWKDDAIYVGIKGGSPDNGHGHMDVGSFVMDAMGVRWAMDFGGQEYNSLESKGVDLWSRKQNSQRWQVFRYNNLAHNTLTFNGAYQLVNGNAPIKNSTSDKAFMSSIVDLTAVYKNDVSGATRGIAIIDESYVVVRDEINLIKDITTVRWSMVTPATVKIISSNTAELTQYGKTVVLKVQEPSTVTLKTWPTNSSSEYDAPNPGTTIIGFETKVASKGSIAFSVLLIPQNQSKVEEKKVPPLNQWNTSIK